MVIVSSGAVGVGAQRLGLHARPSKLPQKQALAAVGQVHLMRFYDDFFSAIGLVGNADCILHMSVSMLATVHLLAYDRDWSNILACL